MADRLVPRHRSRRQAAGSSGAAHGLVAVMAEGEVYVVRVGDGLRVRVAPGTLASFFDGGLAVANGARTHVVPYGQMPSFGVRSSAPPARHSGDQ